MDGGYSMDMSQLVTITIAFLSNTLLLMGISVVYSIFPNSLNIKSTMRKITMGMVVGLIGISIMSNHYELAPGLVFDARAVAMLMTGMFLGTIPALIAAIFMVGFRIFIGGEGVYVGIMWIIVSGGLGLLWRHLRLKGELLKDKKITWYELYFYGLFVQIIMVLLLFFLPDPSPVISQVTIPILIIYPIGSLIISLFMLTQRYRFFQNQKTLESEIQYRNIFNDSLAMLFLIDPETGKIADINDAAARKYGYTKEEMLEMRAHDLSTRTEEEVTEALRISYETEMGYFQVLHRRKDGSLFDVEVHSGPTTINGVKYIYSTVIDVTSLQETKRQFLDADEKLRATFQSVGEGLVVTDEFGNISIINQKAKDLLEIDEDVKGKKIYIIFRIHSTKNDTPFMELIRNALRKNETYKSDNSFALISYNKNKEKFVDFTVSPISMDDNLNHGAILSIRDITIEKKRQEEIRYISQHDYLTGLHNRYFFEEEMRRLDTKRQQPITVVLGDVNGLKLVNDTFTHLEGDNLLIEIASIFKKAVRQEDIVARWGGDEFVILLPQTSEQDATRVYDRIKDLCRKSRYTTIMPSISIGLATKTDSDQDIFETLKMAEARMYREKLTEGKSMRSNLVSTLEKTLVEKSYETEEHGKNMKELASSFGEFLGLSKDQVHSLTLLARLHDIGKISVNNEILNKLEPLTDEDWEQIRIHPETGSRIVQAIPELKHMMDPILHHHERWDGTGYPHNLKAEKIPFLSRIIALIDSYEVMTSGRVYKDSISLLEAITEIENCKGKQFDPELADKFIIMLQSLPKK